MKREACLALCHSLKHTILESNQNYDVAFSDILLFSDEYINGKMKRSLINCGKVLLMIHKIARLYISILTDESTSFISSKTEEELKHMRLSSVGDSIMKVSEWNREAYLAHIIREMLGSSLQHAFLVNELLIIVTSTASKTIEHTAIIKKDLDESLDLVTKEFYSLPIEILSALYLARANTTIHLSNKVSSCEKATIVIPYVDKSLQAITSCIEETSIKKERKLLLLTFYASLLYLKLKSMFENQSHPVFPCHQYQLVIQTCSEAMNIMHNEIDILGEKLSKSVGMSIIWTATKVFQEYYVSSESALCVQNMNLLYNLSHYYLKEFSGFEGFVLPILLKGELDQDAGKLIDLVQPLDDKGNKGSVSDRIHQLLACSTSDDSGSSDLISNVFANSIELESLKASLPCDDLVELSDCSKQFETKFLDFDLTRESRIDDRDVALLLVVHWWLSCCHYVLANGYNRIGKVQRSIFCLRKCINYCKKAIQYSSQFTSSSPSVSELKENSFAIMFINLTSLRSMFHAKKFDCYEALAKMYCYIGQHRTAKGYVIASGQSLCLLPKNVEISSNESINDILKMLSPQVKNVRHLVFRNTLIDIFSRITSETKDDYSIHSIFHGDLTSAVQNVDLLRETILTFILCK